MNKKAAAPAIRPLEQVGWNQSQARTGQEEVDQAMLLTGW